MALHIQVIMKMDLILYPNSLGLRTNFMGPDNMPSPRYYEERVYENTYKK